MRHEDFFTGEEVTPSSPFISEQEAINNAGFAKYDFNPGARMMSQPISMISPGNFGYNPYIQQPMYGYNCGYYPNQQYMQPVGYYGGAINPAIAYQQQIQQQQMNQMREQMTVSIPPVSFGSEYLPPVDYEKKIDQMMMDFWAREQEEIGRNSITQANTGWNPYWGTNNYYGAPYYNPYQYNSINQEAARKIEEMKEEARNARFNLSLNLARLAHNIAGDSYDDNMLRERYTGKTVTLPGMPQTYQEVYEQQRLYNLVPFDNSYIYRQHSIEVTNEHNSIIPADSNLKEMFQKAGELKVKYLLDEEKHRRRNGALLYNSDNNSYKFFVRAKAAERQAQKTGMSLTSIVKEADQAKQALANSFPTLSQSARLTDDGTLNITCNFGSNAGKVYSVHNSEEAGYDQDRERFQQFLDSVPHSIYLDSPVASSS